MATLNGVADKVEVLGAAAANFLAHPSVVNLGSTQRLFLIDIEGGEFDLLTDEVLEEVRHSHLVVELHGRMVRNSLEHEQRLLGRLARWFECTLLTTGARDLSGFPELAIFGDSDRWLICSEGRPYLMQWAYCKPRHIT